jgi:hypothetical protein
MAKRYIVTLTEDERVHLLALTKKGKVSARQLTRAHILLQADAGASIRSLLRRSMWALRRWSGSASASSKRALKRPCVGVHVLGNRASSMANRKLS